MSEAAVRIVEQFRTLPPEERREVVQALLQESQGDQSPARQRSLDEVLGKFTPLPEPEAKDHNHWFAEAILASKRGDDEP